LKGAINLSSKKNLNYEELKQILSTDEGLGIVCFSKHHQKAKMSCTKLSEILKSPINRLKDTCSKLEEMGVIKVNKIGNDHEIELSQHDDEKVKHIIDEIIWLNKEEYGKIYKRIITAELMDFMDGK
jgi:hypothetical protein